MKNHHWTIYVSWFLALSLLLVLCFMPSSHWFERVVFLEDSFWTLSWGIFALTAFRLKKTGFPPAVAALTFALDAYLFFHYFFLQPWTFNVWLLVNYALWPVASGANVVATYLYSKNEIVFRENGPAAIFRLSAEFIFYFTVFYFVGKSFPSHLHMAYFGETTNLLISIHFLVLIFSRENLIGQNLAANFFRLGGSVLCLYLNTIWRWDYMGLQQYLMIIMPAIIALDILYLVVYFSKRVKFR